MTTIDPRTIDPGGTLAALVSAHPEAAVTLDRLGLDYCCGGDRALVDAADEAGLDVEVVIEALSQVPVAPTRAGWATMSPAELVDHLESTHHAYLHDALPRLGALSEKVAQVHGERHPELLRVRELVDELRAELAPHLRKEEQVLFPMIRELTTATSAPGFPCGSLRNPISVMDREHDHAGELLASLRTVANGYEVPADGCASYRALFDGLAELEADTHLHVHKENNVLFPAVLAAEEALDPSGTG